MTAGMHDATIGKFIERIPLGRVGQPDDVAAVIAFLTSDDARFVTGVNLPVDGGLNASTGQPGWVKNRYTVATPVTLADIRLMHSFAKEHLQTCAGALPNMARAYAAADKRCRFHTTSRGGSTSARCMS